MRVIFVSYSRLDAAAAKELAAHVTARGDSVFIDYQDIKGGAEFMDVIGKKIARSEVVLLLLSPRATNSKWVRWEIGWALQLEKRIIPLVLEPVSLKAVFPLVNMHMLDFRGMHDGAHRDRCFSDLDEALSQIQPSASPLADDFVPFATSQAERSKSQLSEDQLHQLLLSALRARDTQPETAAYHTQTILEQSPEYLAGWLKDFAVDLEAQLKESRVQALEARLDMAITAGDTTICELVATDIVELDRANHRAQALLASVAKRKKCDGLYHAAAKTIGDDLDIALVLLLQVRRLEPTYGDPAGLLLGQPITARSCGLVRELHTLEQERVQIHARNHYAFAPSSGFVAASPFYFESQLHSNKVAAYRPGDKETLHILTAPADSRGYERDISKIAFSADGTLLATGGGYGPTVVWDMRTFERIATFNHDGYVLAIALGGTGDVLAAVVARFPPSGSRGAPSRLMLWSLLSAHSVGTFPDHEIDVRQEGFVWNAEYGSLSVSLRQSRVASIWFNRVRVCDYDTCKIIANFKYSYARVLALQPDGERVAVSTGYETALFDLAACQNDDANDFPPSVALPHDKRKPRVSCMTFAPNSDLLVVGREENEIELWDVAQLRCVQTMSSSRLIDLESMVFSEDACRLYVKDIVYGF
jgi:hypothetical protein